jgi:hypothetical protein
MRPPREESLGRLAHGTALQEIASVDQAEDVAFADRHGLVVVAIEKPCLQDGPPSAIIPPPA